MSVSLKKGQKVDLTKGNSGLKRVMVGLGWDEAQKPVGFGRLFGGRSVQDFDCDPEGQDYTKTGCCILQ